MTRFAEHVNFIASLGTVAIQVLTLGLIVIWLVARFGKQTETVKWAREFLAKVGSYALIGGFLVAITSVTISLVYSNVIGFEPCELCWIQRIFLYPQAIILGLALWKKTKDAATYCLALSIIGLLVAGYHYYGQTFNPGALPACAAGGGVSCAVRFFVEFGYITIPLMSFTAFLFLTVCMFLRMRFEAR